MHEIPELWKRINELVPQPECVTRGDDYDAVEWMDDRDLPAAEALEAVDLAAVKAQDAVVEELRSDMMSQDMFLFRMVLAVYQAGVDRGLWTAADFPAALRTKAATIKQRLDALDNGGAATSCKKSTNV